MKEEMKSKWSLDKPLYIEESDDRYKDQMKQLNKRGFCSSETWALGLVIAEFILPRLKEFKKVHPDYPMGMTNREWNKVLGKMIFAFQWVLDEDSMTEEYKRLSDEDKDANWKKYEEGMKLFSENLLDLWW